MVHSADISSSSSFCPRYSCHSTNLQLSPIGKHSKRWYLKRPLFQATDLYRLLCILCDILQASHTSRPKMVTNHLVIQSGNQDFSLDSSPSFTSSLICLPRPVHSTSLSLKSVYPSPRLPCLSYSRLPPLLNFCHDLLKRVFLFILLPPTVHSAHSNPSCL